ncbi:protein of unknown function [Legionella hackeliae]|uniref:Uncharacterized protein n=1 Tax=Legionella hackeliae TaxID=449 RepID=A0A0A8UUW8_LEGHA|nr:protein of unknown function [Legionella hackeliae]
MLTLEEIEMMTPEQRQAIQVRFPKAGQLGNQALNSAVNRADAISMLGSALKHLLLVYSIHWAFISQTIRPNLHLSCKCLRRIQRLR